MGSVALPAVERFVGAGLYLVAVLRLDHVLVRLPVGLLRLLAGLSTFMLCALSPIALTESGALLAECFPDLTPASARRLARQHLTHVMWTMILVTVMPLMSDHQFNRLVDCSRLRALLRERGDRPLVLVASHFFSHVMVAAVSACCHEAGVPACGTMQLTEDKRLSRIIEGLKRRFYWHENVAVNLAATDRAGVQFRKLAGFLRAGRGVVMIFGDYRASAGSGDVPFNVGAGTFHANRGLTLVVPRFSGADVVPIRLLYRSGRLEMVLDEPLPRTRTVEEYYERVLPELIRQHVEQWHLWFLGRNMM